MYLKRFSLRLISFFFYFHLYSNKIKIRFLQVTYLWTICIGDIYGLFTPANSMCGFCVLSCAFLYTSINNDISGIANNVKFLKI